MKYGVQDQKTFVLNKKQHIRNVKIGGFNHTISQEKIKGGKWITRLNGEWVSEDQEKSMGTHYAIREINTRLIMLDVKRKQRARSRKQKMQKARKIA